MDTVTILIEPAFLIGVISAISILVVAYAGQRLSARRASAKQRSKARNSDLAVLEMIVEHAHDGIVVQDVFGRIEWSNPAYSRITGYDADEIRGRRPQEFILPSDEKPSDEEIASYRYDISSGILDSYEIVRNVRKSGEMFWVQLSFAVVGEETDPDLKIIVICRDVTEQIEREEALKKAKQEVEHLALHDVLTGLANRTKLASFLDEYLRQGRAGVGLLHVDLDRFKAVNDTLGHAAGDAVLVYAGNVMRSLVRSDDLVSRVGGDEFVIACPNVADEDALKETAQRLVTAFREPFIWRDRSIHIGASIGISISRSSERDAEKLLHEADIALYQVKSAGRGSFMSFNAELGTIHRHRKRLHAELVIAIRSDQLIVVFQPQEDLKSERIRGFEALVRWQHPEYGILPPAAFFDVAEESGLMPDIDRIAARGALDGLSALRHAGWSDLSLSLNVSSRLLEERDFVETLVREVETRGLKPENVIVEILETTLFSGTDDVTPQSIQQLSDAGFVTELDDFGTGYAGLSHLAQLPIHGVKIDCSMIQGLPRDPTSQAIVRAIIDLCHELGLYTVAEGVERSEQRAFLARAGCSVAQGYGVARPMPLAEAIAWMAKTEPRLYSLGPQQGTPLQISADPQ